MTKNSFSEESDGDFLARVGTDAKLWADAFSNVLGGRPMCSADMVGWFANAIEAGCSAGTVHPAPTDNIPPQNPFTCGTHHVAAEAKLRIIIALGITESQAIETVKVLVDECNIDVAMEIAQELRNGAVPF